MLAGWRQDLPGDNSEYEEFVTFDDAGSDDPDPWMEAVAPFVNDDRTFDRDLLTTLDNDHSRLLLEVLDHPDYVGKFDLERVVYAALQRYAPKCLEATIKLLGSTPTRRYNFGRTLLHEAVNLGAAQCLEILLRYASDPAFIEAKSDELGSPLVAAIRLKRRPCVETLLRHQSSSTVGNVVLAAALNDEDDAGPMHELLACGIDVNMPCEGYVSLLGAAAARGNINVMKELIDNGAKIDELGSNEHSAAYGTPLCTAVVRASIPVVELLLSRGADVKLAGPRGDPLSIARAEMETNTSTETTYREIINLLEAATAEPHIAPQAHRLDQSEEQTALVHAGELDGISDTQPERTDSDTKATYDAGDIVYLARHEHGHLRYIKCFYVRDLGRGSHSVQDCKTQEHFEVHEPDLVLKTSLSAEEVAMAEAFYAGSISPLGEGDEPAGKTAEDHSFHYTAGARETELIDSDTMTLLLRRAHELLSSPPPKLDSRLVERFRDALRSPNSRQEIKASGRLEVMSQVLYSAGFDAIDPADLETCLPQLDNDVSLIMDLLASSFPDDAEGLDFDECTRLILSLRDEQFKVLARQGRRYGLLKAAAERGNLNMLETVLGLSMDVNKTFDRGNTALHYAASGGHASVVRRLLEVGALVDPVNVS